ncbi:MAG: hypothetical protein EOP05_17215 [Proteobacteria bacterium]|nr:MAG: hypothetical protein EOP05_17215 [Pseudomonadota bacterium]
MRFAVVANRAETGGEIYISGQGEERIGSGFGIAFDSARSKHARNASGGRKATGTFPRASEHVDGRSAAPTAALPESRFEIKVEESV